MKILNKQPKIENWEKRKSVSLTTLEASDVRDRVYTHVRVFGELYRITDKMINSIRDFDQYSVMTVVSTNLKPKKY